MVDTVCTAVRPWYGPVRTGTDGSSVPPVDLFRTKSVENIGADTEGAGEGSGPRNDSLRIDGS